MQIFYVFFCGWWSHTGATRRSSVPEQGRNLQVSLMTSCIWFGSRPNPKGGDGMSWCMFLQFHMAAVGCAVRLCRQPTSLLHSDITTHFRFVAAVLQLLLPCCVRLHYIASFTFEHCEGWFFKKVVLNQRVESAPPVTLSTLPYSLSFISRSNYYTHTVTQCQPPAGEHCTYSFSWHWWFFPFFSCALIYLLYIVKAKSNM